MSKHVFGPVPSRRLGFSLGVDPIPRKYCNFDCIYCQVGKTTRTETERKSFFDPEDVVGDVLRHLRKASTVDVITFSGSGEPTLNANLGLMLREVKKKTETPLAVITNGSLLVREDVRSDLSAADVVLPSLDAVDAEIFRQINRPHPSITVDDLLKGLQVFRKGYRGKIWLEIMFVKGLNDTPHQIEQFRTVLQQVSVDKVHLNTITRPAPDAEAHPVGSVQLQDIRQILGSRCEVICGFDKRSEALGIDDWVAEALDVLQRRPLTADDLARVTNVSVAEAARRLENLAQQERVRAVQQGDTLFYVSTESG